MPGTLIPKGFQPEETAIALAEKVLKLNKDRKENKFTILAKYIREGQDGFVMAKSVVNKGQDNEYNEYTVEKGHPYGVVVAFRGLDEKIYLGWSKYCRSKENLPFTKANAIWLAVLRAIHDEICLDEDRPRYGEMEDGTVIASNVVVELWRMADRAERYFGETPANLYFLDEREEEGEE